MGVSVLSTSVSGGDAEFIELVSTVWPRLVRSAILMGCEPYEAEDLAQATLIKCYVHWRKLQRATDVDAYIYRMLSNVLSSAKRKRSSTELPSDMSDRIIERNGGIDPGSSRSLNDAELRVSMTSALRKLDERSRRILVLKYFADLTETQIGEILGLPLGTVKSRLSRAKDRLQSDDHLRGLREY